MRRRPKRTQNHRTPARQGKTRLSRSGLSVARSSIPLFEKCQPDDTSTKKRLFQTNPMTPDNIGHLRPHVPVPLRPLAMGEARRVHRLRTGATSECRSGSVSWLRRQVVARWLRCQVVASWLRRSWRFWEIVA